jgi:hypothetical protein
MYIAARIRWDKDIPLHHSSTGPEYFLGRTGQTIIPNVNWDQAAISFTTFDEARLHAMMDIII